MLSKQSSMARLTSSDSLLLPYPYSEDDLCDYTFKIIVIGDVSVGKTCVLQRFQYGTYSERHVSTIGVDFTSKTIKLDGKTIQVRHVPQNAHTNLNKIK